MHASVTVTPTQLPELLLHVAVVRPVFIWGQPGIGKSSLVEEFAAQVGLECHTLLGTQLQGSGVFRSYPVMSGM